MSKAHEYLSQLTNIEIRIDNLLEEAEKWHSKATSVSVSTEGERVKASGSQQRMADAATQATFYEMQAREKAGDYMAKEHEILEKLNAMSDIVEYRVLYLKYVKRKGITEISREIHFSRATTGRILNRALSNFEKKLKNDTV